MNNKVPILYYDKETDRIHLEQEAAKKLGKDVETPYTYLAEDENLVFRPRKIINTLYHYCSVDTMTSILQGRNLRLSNCRYSNDSEELLYSTRKLEGILKQFIEDTEKLKEKNISDKDWDEFTGNADKYLKNTSFFNDDIQGEAIYKENLSKFIILTSSQRKTFLIDSLNKFLLVWKDLQKHLAPIYISCFSEAQDSLSQWWGYGNDGKGVAIGFDADQLDELKNENIPLKQILYHPNLQFNSLYYYLAQYINNPDTIKEWIYHVLPTFKPIGFKEEKEYRLVYPSTTNSKLNFGQAYRNNKMHYFYELPLSKLKITEVVIGPKSELNPVDIVFLFLKNGIQIDESQIKKSELSYR